VMTVKMAATVELVGLDGAATRFCFFLGRHVRITRRIRLT
jgi:hypothetical protein